MIVGGPAALRTMFHHATSTGAWRAHGIPGPKQTAPRATAFGPEDVLGEGSQSEGLHLLVPWRPWCHKDALGRPQHFATLGQFSDASAGTDSPCQHMSLCPKAERNTEEEFQVSHVCILLVRNTTAFPLLATVAPALPSCPWPRPRSSC